MLTRLQSIDWKRREAFCANICTCIHSHLTFWSGGWVDGLASLLCDLSAKSLWQRATFTQNRSYVVEPAGQKQESRRSKMEKSCPFSPRVNLPPALYWCRSKLSTHCRPKFPQHNWCHPWNAWVATFLWMWNTWAENFITIFGLNNERICRF